MLSFLLLLPLFPHISQAALPTEAPSSISFYRTRTSTFPSGQLSRQELEEKILRMEKENHIEIEWNQKKYALKEDQLIEEIDVCSTAEVRVAAQSFKFPDLQAESTFSLSPNAKVKIKNSLGAWMQIENTQKQTGWVLKKHLKSVNADQGVFLTLIPTALRESPSQTSVEKAAINASERLQPLEYQNGFIKVEYGDKSGWVDMWHLVGRMDFAKFAYEPKHKWIEVSHRLNDQVITKIGSSIPVSKVIGWYADENRALIRYVSDTTPPLRAHLRILSKSQDEWVLSKVEKHGEVWWKRNDSQNKSKLASNKILTTDLLKKDLYSIAFRSKDSLAGLVSSDGVWRSLDGESWEPIARFEKSNLPVAIWPGGAWYVGSYRSLDQGKTFEPFIRWEKLTEVLESAIGRPPKQIKITQLNPTSANNIEITVDTGYHNLKLSADVQSNNWRKVH